MLPIEYSELQALCPRRCILKVWKVTAYSIRNIMSSRMEYGMNSSKTIKIKPYHHLQKTSPDPSFYSLLKIEKCSNAWRHSQENLIIIMY